MPRLVGGKVLATGKIDLQEIDDFREAIKSSGLFSLCLFHIGEDGNVIVYSKSQIDTEFIDNGTKIAGALVEGGSFERWRGDIAIANDYCDRSD